MTDRVKGFYVALEKDMRIDDVQKVLNAVKMIRYIADTRVSVVNIDDWMNRSQVKHELQQDIFMITSKLNS